MWLVLIASLAAAPAAEQGLEPEAGAEARVLSCGYSSKVYASVYRWEVTDGVVSLTHRTGKLDTGAKVPSLKGGDGMPSAKPPIGCPFGLPGPDAAWKLRDVTRWTRGENGWVDAKGRPVTVSCSEKTLNPVTAATALVPNPKSMGCAADHQLMLKGGPRVEKKVVRCVVRQASQESLEVTFGVELVITDNDCGGGSDFRVHD